MKPKIIIILGPTGAGKTQLALALAQKINGEIVIADSMQIYRYMDIGTAKPTREEQALVPHHLLDIINPDEVFSAGRYYKLARKVIDSIWHKGKRVLVCGGTGLYIKSLLYGFSSEAEDDTGKIEQELRQKEAQMGQGYLYQELKKVDPISALRIHPNDTFRIIRALEVFYLTGQPISQYHQKHAFRENYYDYLALGIRWERPYLYERINQRCEQMIKTGFVEEVKSLLARGYHSGLKSMRSLGYRHLCAYLEGKITWEEALATMKRDTRQYARRQLIWFQRNKKIIWLEDPFRNLSSVEDLVLSFLEK